MGLLTNPPNFGLSEKQRRVMQAYYASVLFLDANVGRLLALDATASGHFHLLLERPRYGLSDTWKKQTVFEHSARHR